MLSGAGAVIQEAVANAVRSRPRGEAAGLGLEVFMKMNAKWVVCPLSGPSGLRMIVHGILRRGSR
jgi:hypothetical protein